MKRINYTQTIFLLAFVTLLFSACDPDDDNTCCDPTNPECSNYDPCYGKIPTTAEFKIAQQYAPFGSNATIYIEDSVLTYGTGIRFKAVEQEGASYRWILGLDTVYNETEVYKTIGSLPPGAYPVFLQVTKTPDSLCFSADDGVANRMQHFHLINGCDAIIYNRFKGVFTTSPEDTTIIELALSSSLDSIAPCIPFSGGPSGIFSVNFNGLGDTIGSSNISGAVNSQIEFNSAGAVDEPDGTLKVDPATGEVTAEYTIGDTNYSFRGVKL